MYTRDVKLEPFVPEIVRHHDRGKPWVEWIPGTVLFADVSGFTPMSEALAALGAEGAEVLTDILNRYFAEMIGILNSHGGQVMKFGGDAILCFLEGPGTLDAALHASIRMQDAMKRFHKVRTPVKAFTLQMKIGVAAGECLLAGLGDPATRCEYAFAGKPVDLAAEAEHHAAAGEIILAPEFSRVLEATVVPAAPPASEAASSPEIIRPYMIPEVHDMVAAGYQRYVGALSGAVSVFLQFTGFQFDRDLDLQRLNQFVNMVLEITQEYGGRLNRLSMGDKGSTMLLLFGTPAALEKKEQTACQWAVEVRNTVRGSFPELQLRLGMTSGRVFSGIVGGAGRFEFTVMGDCVNLAARLMQGARPDEICADASMREKAWEAFEFDSLGTRRFKGKSEALEVFALRDRRSLRTRQSSAVYGRTEEVNTVLKLLQPACVGNPCMIVLEGEPGVGKSALAAQLLTLAGQDWRIVTGRGDITRRGFTYNPWCDPYLALVFDGRVPGLDTLTSVLESAGFAEHLAWHADFLGLTERVPETDTVRYDEESKRNLLHHQVSVLMLRAVQSPVLLFLDDLHWFKSAHLDLLTALLNHVKDQPLAILSTARPDWPRDPFVNRSTCHFLALQPLQREAIREVAEKLLEAPVRDNIVEYLEKQARGNPFFLRQLLDYLMRNELVTLRLGEWTLSREGVLDRSLSGEEIVATQVEQLSLPQKMHLRAAACIGPTLSPLILQKALGRNFRARVLQSLRGQGYLQDTIEGRLAFPHALFQEALYQSLPKRLRRQYHRRIGYALEEHFAAEKDQHLPTLAHHFYEGGVRNKAIDYCIAAGNEYHVRKSSPEALELLERALVLLRNTTDQRKWDVALRVADNMIRTGHTRECLTLIRKVITMARKAGRLDVFFRCSAIQFDSMSRAANYSYLGRARQLLKHPALEANISPSRIRYYVGLAFFRMARFDQASHEFLNIIQSSKDPTPTLLSSHTFLASIAKMRQDYETALELLDQAYSLAIGQNDVYRELSISIEKGNVLVERGEHEQSELLFFQLLERANALGDYYLVGVILLNLAHLMMDQENYEKAEFYLRESKEIFSKLGVISMIGKTVMDTGAICFYRLDYEKALEYYQEALCTFERTKQMDHGCFAYYNIAEALSRLNRKQEALLWIERGIKTFESSQRPALAKLYQALYKSLTSNSTNKR